MPSLFASSRGQQEKKEEDLTAALYQQIGQIKVELDWMKKNLVLAVTEKKELIEPTHRSISIARQCELLGLARSSFYYEPIAISQDGRGRALDNIFVERLWRSVKYEEVPPKAYTFIKEAIQELDKYFHLVH
jgi:putative transposase